MKLSKLAVTVGSLALLVMPVSLLHAQAGGRPGGPGGGFGWGQGSGVRVLDARAGGCMFEGRGFGKDSSTNYYLTLSDTVTRAILPGFTPPPTTPPTRTVIHTGGITYVDSTRNSKTEVCINDPANHERYVVSLTSLSPPTGTALEFKLESRSGNFGGRPPRDGGKGGKDPSWTGKTNPDVTHATITKAGDFASNGVTLSPAQLTAVTAAFSTWTSSCTTLTLTAFKHGQSQDARVTCAPLGVGVFNLVSDPYVNSNVIATFTSPATPVISLPLTNYPDIKVKVVNGGGRPGRHGGPKGPGAGA